MIEQGHKSHLCMEQRPHWNYSKTYWISNAFRPSCSEANIRDWTNISDGIEKCLQFTCFNHKRISKVQGIKSLTDKYRIASPTRLLQPAGCNLWRSWIGISEKHHYGFVPEKTHFHWFGTMRSSLWAYQYLQGKQFLIQFCLYRAGKRSKKFQRPPAEYICQVKIGLRILLVALTSYHLIL